MLGSPASPLQDATAQSDNAIRFQLPLPSMVRALCRAAATSTDALYEVMLKLALMIDATAQTYGLATFAQKSGERPLLKWTEGLEQDELTEAEAAVAAALSKSEHAGEMRAGDHAICLVLTLPSRLRHGTAIYGRCMRPLNEKQARELRILTDVAQLAHSHAHLREEVLQPSSVLPSTATHATHTLPGIIFVSRQMSDLARSVERIKDSDSTVLITGESGTGK